MVYDEMEVEKEIGSDRDSSPERTEGYSLTKYLSCLRWLSFVAVIFPRSLQPANNRKSHELHSTAYLDALRGYAAWIVYNSHVIHDDWRPETGVFSIPWVKIVVRGHSMVDIFFIISGFALSYRMMGFIYAQQSMRVLDSLASSTFRRYMRLFVPTAFATFVAMVAVTLGVLDKTDGPNVKQQTLLGNVGFWIADTVQASNPFAHVYGWWAPDAPGSNYLPQMWTIPVEFRGSMVLFLFCAASCKMTPRVRWLVTWISIVACFWWKAMYVGLFLVGMWLADCRQYENHQALMASHPILPTHRHSSSSSSTATLCGDLEPEKLLEQDEIVPETSSPTSDMTRQSNLAMAEPPLLQQLPYIVLLLWSIVIMTAPLLIKNTSDFPYNLFATFMPPSYTDIGAWIHWPLSLGAVHFMFALEHAPILQKPLLTPFSQFVGELSFGIYAMHNTVRWIVWEQILVKWQFNYWGVEPKGFFYLVPGYIIMTVLVIWAAEAFRRVDVKVIAWTKVLSDLCFE